MKKYLLLLALVCLLGNRALAQNRGVMKQVTETIDFTVTKQSGNPNVNFGFNSNNNPMINNQVVSERITVDNTGYWQFWGSDAYHESYLQKNTNSNTSYVYLSGLNVDDIVTIWGEVGNNQGSIPGAYNITSGATLLNTTYFEYNGNNLPDSKQYRITEAGTATIQVDGNYSGIRKITIQYQVRAEDYFNYDPGYEDYDMYDEFSENDPKKWRHGQELDPHQWSTSYTLSEEETGITLNGQTAQFIVLDGSKITANNRIAIDPNSGDWRFNYGLRAPDNGKWANFSICNLKEGDRVVFSYTGTAPVFSSVAGGTTAPTGPYNGSKAFADQYNDGIFDEGEDVYITSGANPVTDWDRDEGNFYSEDHQGEQGNYKLYYTRPYVITEDGHLDIAIAPDTRIVKIKIYSDHQATMIDEYDTQTESYVAKFDITGELQAKEHIMPGGLEVHVGSDDASQHANVVSSSHGPVSIVNGVNGYKLPGISLDDDGKLLFQFDLESHIPTTGTFYKFMPLEKGQMTLTFQAASMNYYSYSFNGDAVYYGHSDSYTDNSGWTEKFDRPNEQTRNVDCPYYLVKVTVRHDGTLSDPSKVKFTYKIKNSNGTTSEGTIDPNSNDESKRVLKALNGADITISPVEEVKEDEIYYLYGGWNATGLFFNGSGEGLNNLEYFPNDPWNGSTNGNGGKDKACGVAKLLEVVFNPNRKVYPLAKWVPNGTTAVNTANSVPNPDTFDPETYLADLWGYNKDTKITVKKMSGNILTCNPYIEEIPKNQQVKDGPTARLMIKNITFDDGKDQGGTILIKIGNTDKKSNPVYTLTIAYSANPTYDGNSGTGTRGHIWDYSTSSLHGFDWEPGPADAPKPDYQGVFTNDLTANSKYAQPKDYGHYFANYFAADISGYSSADEVFTKLGKSESGLLYDEINAQGTHSRNTDWSFNYNLVNAGNLYDPLFMNKYDTEGDNADLIWETEGTVIIADANASVMFNEFTGTDIHSSEKDPERYVGILNSKNSEFRIPWLMPNDRVIIYMGTGKGAFNDQAVFNIRGAYDAVHNVIDPTDDYIVGGSHWNVVKNEQGQVVTNDPYYRGCYHFFAQGHDGGPADMVFKMTSGSMCKIYKIQIYRGDRIITNEIKGATSDDKFLLWSRAKDPNDANDVAAIGSKYNWTLKYFGKDQKLADGSGNNEEENEIIAKTGIITDSSITTDAANNTFTYQHALGEIGTFRMRGKDMEKNMNYVADYADHNVTVALQETQKYPYTWDFKDMVIYDNASFVAEDAIGPSKHDWFIPNTTDEDEIAAWDEAWNTSYEKSSEDLSLWVGKNGTYELRLNSQEDQTTSNPMEKDNIFQTATQNYDGNQLWAGGQVVPETKGLWFYTDNNNREAGQWKITNKGMALNGSTGWAHKMVVPNVPKNAAVYLRMVATKNANFTEQFKTDNENCEVFGITQVPSATDEWIFAILNKGEKQNLVLSFDGYRLLKLAVSEDPKTVNIKGYASESRNRVIDHTLTSFFTGKDIKAYLAKEKDENTISLVEITKPMPAATDDGEFVGSVLYNSDNNNDTGEIKVLDGGFHLFVPDMNDYHGDPSDTENMVTNDLQSTIGNMMQSFNAGGTSSKKLSQTAAKDIYVLSYKYLEHDRAGQDTNIGQFEAFYRLATSGANVKPNSAYIQLGVASTSQAKMSIVFEDELFGNQGITTSIDDAVEENVMNGKAEWYSLDGRKLNGVPTAKGLYIVNGKKVLVK